MSLVTAVGALVFVAGAGLLVGGIYELAGPGWALIAGSVPCLFVSVVILRGAR